jgi:hypothetical protein
VVIPVCRRIYGLRIGERGEIGELLLEHLARCQRESIGDAFGRWSGKTTSPPLEGPSLLYIKQREVMDFGLLVASEIKSFVCVLGETGLGADDDHRRVQAARALAHLSISGRRLDPGA